MKLRCSPHAQSQDGPHIRVGALCTAHRLAVGADGEVQHTGGVPLELRQGGECRVLPDRELVVATCGGGGYGGIVGRSTFSKKRTDF